MKWIVAVFCFFALLPTIGFAGESPTTGMPPAWFLDEIETLTAGTGRWITSNSNYKTAEEPYEEYGTEWRASFDGTTMTGRLFGILDGKATANFWEFRQYWHPQKRVVVLEQFGWGAVVGLGVAWRHAETTKSKQSFFAADGTESLSGHISSFPDRLTQ